MRAPTGVSLSTVTGAAGPTGDKGESTVPPEKVLQADRCRRGWGSARAPFHDALCISTHRPGRPIFPPTQIPVPGSRERGAPGVAVGHVLPLSRGSFP